MEKYYILDTINFYRTYFIDDEKRPVIVIAAGGGYQYTSERESEPVQEAYNKAGYHAVIVNYRESKEDAYPKPSTYLAHAIKEIKKDPRCGKLILLGFSAGGHNALEVSLHSDKYGVKLDLLMLGYPVVTADERYSHKGSFMNLLKDKYGDEELMNTLSMETQVNKDAPDLFLWGTFTDESVNVMNSLLLLQAYKNQGLNAEYHVYPMGGHGLSLATMESCGGDYNKVNPYIQQWFNQSLEWLKYKLK